MDLGREAHYYIQKRALKKVYEPLIYADAKLHSFRLASNASFVFVCSGVRA